MTAVMTHDDGGRRSRTKEDLIEEIKALEGEIADIEAETASLRNRKDNGELKDAINDLLNEVERPVGTFRAHVPQTPASERALIALFDIVGRTL